MKKNIYIYISAQYMKTGNRKIKKWTNHKILSRCDKY